MVSKRFLLSNFIILFSMLSFYQCGSDNNIDKGEVIPKEESDEYAFVYDIAKTYFGEPIEGVYANKTGNEYSAQKVALGEKLFHDFRLSKDNSVSCATCHNLDSGGVDNLPTSVGINGQKGPRNAPTVFNAALNFKQFWDGRAEDVEEQAGGPILNPIEMGMDSEQEVVDKIRNISEYQTLFKNAFPNLSEPITFETITKAIASFERTLIKPSKFDKFLAGDKDILTTEEKRGVHLFITNKCFQCHKDNLVGGLKFSTFGTPDRPYWLFTGSENHDLGLIEITNNETDILTFKAPSLRNVAQTAPYFHDGSVSSLTEAIKIMAKIQFETDLTDKDAKSIEAFLKTLTSE